MIHKSFDTAAGTTVPACLAHEPDATGFKFATSETEVDCALCRNPRKARRYAREFAKRHTGPKAPAMRVTVCGDVAVVR